MQDPTTSGVPGGTTAFALPSDNSLDTTTSQPASAMTNKATPTATASSLANQAKQTLVSKLDEQKGTAANLVEQLAKSVQKSGEQFEGQQDWIASAIGRGATELNTLAGSLRDKDLGELTREVQSFARRQPALFIGATLVAGFAVARLGKIVAGDVSREDLPTVPEVGHGQH
ncbi:MAG: hypothetical protein EOP64_09415 [Sphingomonas sp.]|nr:MAG: hypothetical protein EOP64_09415 [Sphingomonas sp.]